MAITGGIAEGKSTVLQIIRDCGLSVASSDEAARSVFADPGHQAAMAELAGLPLPLSPNALRERMLDSHDIRRAINRYTHPLIVAATKNSGAAFVEIPLLFEVCRQNDFDQVWVVTCGLEEQRRRLMDRYRDATLVQKLLGVQIETPVKILFADFVIRTNRSVETVRSELCHAVRRLSG